MADRSLPFSEWVCFAAERSMRITLFSPDNGKSFTVDNDSCDLANAHAEEGMGEGILNVGSFQVLLGKWADQFGCCKASNYRSIASTRASSFLIFFVKSGSLGSATIYLFHWLWGTAGQPLTTELLSTSRKVTALAVSVT
jgi:hypothetical protein